MCPLAVSHANVAVNHSEVNLPRIKDLATEAGVRLEAPFWKNCFVFKQKGLILLSHEPRWVFVALFESSLSKTNGIFT